MVDETQSGKIIALLKATEGACVRKELDLSDFWPTGLYVDHQVICDGRVFLELYAEYLCFHPRVCVCVRVCTHSSLQARTLGSQGPTFSASFHVLILEKNICSLVIYLLTLKFVLFLFQCLLCLRNSNPGQQIKRMKTEEHTLNYRMSPDNYFQGPDHLMSGFDEFLITSSMKELFFCLGRCFSSGEVCTGFRSQRYQNWNSGSIFSCLPYVGKITETLCFSFLICKLWMS